MQLHPPSCKGWVCHSHADTQHHHHTKVCQHTSVKLWWYPLSVCWSHSRMNSFQLLIAPDGYQTASGYLYLDDGESLNTDQTNNYTLLQFVLHNVSLGMQAFALLLGNSILRCYGNVLSFLLVYQHIHI